MDLYKVILVDDEEDVRVSIEKKVNWKELGFELVGSVSNGEEALELTEQMSIDVVMTDIKMPFMDGLTLCSKVKNSYKNTKVVLLSGFDDFEFAREAIHLEAEEYLLKPIGAQDLENVFHKIKDNLDKELDERRNIENLREYYNNSLPMLKEQLLTGLLSGNISGKKATGMIQSYEMQLLSPFYSVALVRGDFRNRTKDLQTNQMLTLSLMNMAREYLEKNMQVQIFMYMDRIAVIGCLQDRDEIQNFIYHVNQVCKTGSRMLEANVDAGIGQAYSSLDKIYNSYIEAKEALDYRLLLGEKNQAIFINDVEPYMVGYSEVEGIDGIMHSIKFGTKEDLQEAIHTFMEEIKAHKMPIQQFQLTFMELFTEMWKMLRNQKIDMEEIFEEPLHPYDLFENVSSVDEMTVWLNEKSIRIWEALRKNRAASTSSITEKAKKYIEENYSNSSLSVEDLCKHLNVSATYFSVMFKKEMGMSFVSYLTKVRLAHAVDLLDHTDDKSYMIAEKVGYTEANYFSYVFKKQYGISPTKYKQNKG